MLPFLFDSVPLFYRVSEGNRHISLFKDMNCFAVANFGQFVSMFLLDFAEAAALVCVQGPLNPDLNVIVSL